MIKKLLLPVLLLCAFSASAQLNNSWIDYSKTYFKFKMGSDNLTRIPQSTLSAAGLGSANADNFQLWRNGQQVRLFTSVSGTTLGIGDYLEFMGEMNDGKADKPLYRQPSFQLADKYSMETDTAVYFLTVNTLGGNLRYTNLSNPSPGAASPDAYFMRSIDVYYRSRLNRGYAKDLGEYVYSSSYDNGEGFTTGEINPGPGFTETISGLNVYTAGPSGGLSLRGKFFGNSDNSTRTAIVKLFGTQAGSVTFNSTSEGLINVTGLPISLLQNTSSVPVNVSTSIPGGSTITDRIVVATLGITYPATFNFNNLKSFSFELAASATGNYLLIDNFNYGTVAPVLYDINSGRRYVGDITSTPGKVKFVLPASADPIRRFILNNAESSSANSINTLSQKTFTDYNAAANRADYVIISNPVLYNDGTGVNQVEQYRAYRASANGGGYNAKVFDINDLTDQFAFGIKKHPAAVRDFVRFMDVQYPVKPKFIFIIGRGLTHTDRFGQESNPVAEQLDHVTTFGWPPSDILLVSQPGTTVPITPVGRLGAINGTEVGKYLQKAIQYETAQRTQSPTIADKAWMKNVMQIAGGKDVQENNQFNDYMDGYRNILKDTLFGGYIEKFSKTSVATVQQASSARIAQLFQEGLGYIQYFGHSSASTFEFNLSSPEVYNNTGKYPFFNASGCTAGNYYTFDPQRLTGNLTLSDKYVFADQKGSIGFLASSHFGIPFALDSYNLKLHKNFSLLMYGQSVGAQIKDVNVTSGGLLPGLDYYTRLHLEQINLHGDPAIKINSFPKADYVIEEQSIKINPSIISVADPSFNVKIEMRNIGRAVNQSIRVYVKRLLPNTTVPVTIIDTLLPVPAIKNADSLNLNIPINPVTDKGMNRLIVELDWTNKVNEIYETNNKITKDFFIFEDELRPVYPYNYSIINNQNFKYSASTANPLVSTRSYVMEVDTTELFNSSFKKTYNNSGPGGVIEFTPNNLTYTDSTVYYWRTAVVPANGNYIWNNFSFVYLPASTPGFNQSHYYQHLKNDYDDNIFMSGTRQFKYNSFPTALNVSTGNFPPNDFPLTTVSLGAFLISNWGNQFNTLQFTVLDGVTGTVVKNAPGGLYGSNNPGPRMNQFEFPFASQFQRDRIATFISLMPANATIVMYALLYNPSVNAYAPIWQTDSGPSPNLYNVLKGNGFTQIDSFYRNIPMIFKFTKDGSAPSFQKVGLTTPEVITAEIPITISKVNGNFTSPLIGPAKSWTSFHWRGSSLESPTKDSILFNIIGINSAGTETVLYSVDSTVKDFNISAINAAAYPYLKLQMSNTDSLKGSPYQLRYWRIKYSPVAEGAVAPNIKFTMSDTVEVGEPINFSLAFKNVSQYNFDQLMKINLRIKTASNFDSVINIPKGKVLIAGDTIMVFYKIPSENYQGNNTLFIEFNPNNDQPEQTHFNNVLYKDFFVRSDKFNPLLDVTFDGVHILSRDIVASRPNILIKLKDESRFLALKDTSLIKVQLRYPDQSLHAYNFNGDTLRFIPANLAAGENTASIEFKPYLPQDGEYELIISGKDASGNTAGNLDYRVVFTVINKPMISEMLNYPNPFTTSTAFVFTLTGSTVPQNMRIQVLTITGKVVREITKDELGPIHVGRNITEFKWDGTDMYGQKLANGVYLYRVLTNLNGKSLEKYKADGDNTEKYFNKGYGKMYLMR